MQVFSNVHVDVLKMAVKLVGDGDAAHRHLDLAHWCQLSLLASPVHHQLFVYHALDNIFHPHEAGADCLKLPGPLFPSHHEELKEVVFRLQTQKGG